VAPGTKKRLVHRVGKNGEVHETPILTTYRRTQNEEEYKDLDDVFTGTLSIIYTLFFFNAR
jgi:hypothetical protein